LSRPHRLGSRNAEVSFNQPLGGILTPVQTNRKTQVREMIRILIVWSPSCRERSAYSGNEKGQASRIGMHTLPRHTGFNCWYSRVQPAGCAVSIISRWGRLWSSSGLQEVAIAGLGGRKVGVADACGPRADEKCGSSASCGFGSTRPFRPAPCHASQPQGDTRRSAVPQRRQRRSTCVTHSTRLRVLQGPFIV